MLYYKSIGKTFKEKIKDLIVEIEEEDWATDYELLASIDPGNFRIIGTICSSEFKGKATIEVLAVSHFQSGDAYL